MTIMAELLERGRYADEIMQLLGQGTPARVAHRSGKTGDRADDCWVQADVRLTGLGEHMRPHLRSARVLGMVGLALAGCSGERSGERPTNAGGRVVAGAVGEPNAEVAVESKALPPAPQPSAESSATTPTSRGRGGPRKWYRRRARRTSYSS